MKFFETSFDDYNSAVENSNLHTKIDKYVFSKFPDNILDLCNVIFYGPPGIGKYSQAIHCITKYSNSQLKYVKKLPIIYNKKEYLFRISDIHFEIDMSILGCNSKLLWHEVYQQILDIISSRSDKHGIILCKNFHDTHSELLENFYIYMQKNSIKESHLHIVFFIISESISFLPENILDCSQVINFSRPPATQYKKCTSLKKLPPLNEIINIKNLYNNHIPVNNHDQIFQNITRFLTNYGNIDLTILREQLYDILIYNIDIHEIGWRIFQYIVSNDLVSEEDIQNVLLQTYKFFKYYNNNYRPIYHMEHYVLTLFSIIHKNKMVSDKT